jgi:hypothetical protein
MNTFKIGCVNSVKSLTLNLQLMPRSRNAGLVIENR